MSVESATLVERLDNPLDLVATQINGGVRFDFVEDVLNQIRRAVVVGLYIAAVSRVVSVLDRLAGLLVRRKSLNRK